MSKGKCPYTRAVMYKAITTGSLIEVDPTKKDHVLELGEEMEYMVEYNNVETHAKRPLSGLVITLRKPDMKVTTQITDFKGKIYLKPDQVGRWLLSYNDAYQKRTIAIMFEVTAPILRSDPLLASTMASPAPVEPIQTTFTVEAGPKPLNSKNPMQAFMRAFLGLFKRK